MSVWVLWVSGQFECVFVYVDGLVYGWCGFMWKNKLDCMVRGGKGHADDAMMYVSAIPTINHQSIYTGWIL